MSTPRTAEQSGPHLRYIPVAPIIHAVDVTLRHAERVRVTSRWVAVPGGLGLWFALVWLLSSGVLPSAWLQAAGVLAGVALLALPFHVRARCRQDAALGKVVEALRGMGGR